MHRDKALREPALAKVEAIEAELRRLGWWSEQPPAEDALREPGPFGMRSLSPEQWLQFVLIPRVREAAAGANSFPRASNVAAWAVREQSACPEDCSALQKLLGEFDALFEPTLFRTAAAWDPAVEAFLADPALLHGPGLFGLPDRHDPATWAALSADLEAALDAGSEVNWRDPRSGRTALMVAIAFGCDPLEQLLLGRGADPLLSDSAGRNAADWRILRLQARLCVVLAGLPAVASARLAQLFFPGTRRFSSALVALELDAPLAPEAFADLPASDPCVLMPLGQDAVSLLARFEPPFWRRESRPLR
jgi:uncharacterized protein YqcC (DUF446 family)